MSMSECSTIVIAVIINNVRQPWPRDQCNCARHYIDDVVVVTTVTTRHEMKLERKHFNFPVEKSHGLHSVVAVECAARSGALTLPKPECNT